MRIAAKSVNAKRRAIFIDGFFGVESGVGQHEMSLTKSDFNFRLMIWKSAHPLRTCAMTREIVSPNFVQRLIDKEWFADAR